MRVANTRKVVRAPAIETKVPENTYRKKLPAPPAIDYESLTDEDILRSQYIRLNTIYYIVDVNGKRRPFRMNPEQYYFYRNMHDRNIILKARQRGFTTLIQIFLLDIALFTPDTSCGVIAHNLDDAKKFFSKKIKYAFDNIPSDFKARYCPNAVSDNKEQLSFDNGSHIYVGTSLRSDTVQYLHVSEFGKMCAKYPEKADEVVSGALNAVHVGNWITIESTGEGTHGHFYEMTEIAKKRAERGEELTPMDYKFFFFPWWEAKEYQLRANVKPTADQARYFRELYKQSGVRLTEHQRAWYCKKEQEQREKMWREFPSIPEESFRGIIEGAPFSRIISDMRRTGRICKVRWAKSFPVYTFWDLGRNDKTAIWFMQHIGHEIRFINYYEHRLVDLSHYAKILLGLPYVYAEHYLPHDAEVVELTRADGLRRDEVLNALGLTNTVVTPRIGLEMEAIEMTRNAMDNVYIDAERCAKGITALENARFKFSKELQEYQPNLMRTKHKHGADAFMQYGQGYSGQIHTNTLSSASTSDLGRENRTRVRSRKTDRQSARSWRI